MLDNQNLFFSIIVTAYNLEKYIDRAISSILYQNFQDFELIIVDDGSIDNTTFIIDKYAKSSNKITVITHQKNESTHIARMDGVAAAKGKYILFLDGDDYFTEDAFLLLYAVIQKNPGYDFYEYGYIRQPAGKKVFPASFGTDRFLTFFDKTDYPAPTMWNKVYDSVLIKKSFASMEKSYIIHIEDTYESIVIAFFSKNIMIIDKIIINYQVGSGISTTYKDYNNTIVFLHSIRTMINLVEVFLQNNNINICLDNFNFRFLELTILYYINSQKNVDDMKKLFLALPDFFDTNLIMEYLFYREEKWKETLPISGSKYYELYINILKKLRKVKRLFTGSKTSK